MGETSDAEVFSFPASISAISGIICWEKNPEKCGLN